ncbi:LacI family DNA-binding transcriptional regulator [Glaciecola sp. 1036]|uniref:LacI family DNA-binding transcriptional regulator n=1 Tax=Alteromonadaceae TaxID=72275 RepID=UPI003D042BFC
MSTIYEVSKLAGVSLATVSRVMNGSARVSETTQRKVKDAMEQLGYRPNSAAISLASKRSNCIGILVAELDGVFFGSMMSGIEATLREFNKHVVVTAGHSDEKDELDGIEFLRTRNCDAIIVHAEKLTDAQLIELAKGDIPLFIINRNIQEIANRCISLDNIYGGYLATKHVLENGHRDIVNISGPDYKMDASERVVGFKNALEEYAIDYDPERIFIGNYHQESGAAAIDHFLEQQIPFTAVICGNDQMAIGAMSRLRELNRTPAEDVAIVGFDDVSFAACTFPTLTTIRYPIDKMGQQMANLVLSKVYQIKISTQIQHSFEPLLIQRQSVNAIG